MRDNIFPPLFKIIVATSYKGWSNLGNSIFVLNKLIIVYNIINIIVYNNSS